VRATLGDSVVWLNGLSESIKRAANICPQPLNANIDVAVISCVFLAKPGRPGRERVFKLVDEKSEAGNIPPRLISKLYEAFNP